MDDSEPRDAAGMPEGRAAIQRDKDRTGKWANGNLVKSNRHQCKASHLGRRNPLQRHRLGTAWPGNSSAGKTQGHSRLGMGQPGCKDGKQHPGLYQEDHRQ